MRQKAQSTKVIYTGTDKNKQTTAIAITIAINWSSHGLRQSHTSDPTFQQEDQCDHIRVTFCGMFVQHFPCHYNYNATAVRSTDTLAYSLEMNAQQLTMDEGQTTVVQCHISFFKENYPVNNKNMGPVYTHSNWAQTQLLVPHFKVLIYTTEHRTHT